MRQIVAPLLPEGGSKRTQESLSPEPARELVLGPADGGPHRPEYSAHVIKPDFDFADGETVSIELDQLADESNGGYSASLRREEDDEDDREMNNGMEDMHQNGQVEGTRGEGEEDWVFSSEMDVGEEENVSPSLNGGHTTLYSPLKSVHLKQPASMNVPMDMSPEKPAKRGGQSYDSGSNKGNGSGNAGDPFLTFVATQRDQGELHGKSDHAENGHEIANEDLMEED